MSFIRCARRASRDLWEASESVFELVDQSRLTVRSPESAALGPDIATGAVRTIFDRDDQVTKVAARQMLLPARVAPVPSTRSRDIHFKPWHSANGSLSYSYRLLCRTEQNHARFPEV